MGVGMEQNYHDIPALNASSISDYMRSPLHFWMHSSLNPDREKKDKTPAMIFGSLCHCLVLEPEAFDKEFIVSPNINKCTKAGKEEWAAFTREAGSRDVITEETYGHAVAMRDAMFANSAVKNLLGNGCSEQPVFWTKEEGGVLCKAKLDYSRQGLLIDYKTTADASYSTFSKSIANFGYHRQMAWYMDAFEHQYNERPKGAVIIAQEKDLPDAIGIYAIKGSALEIGKKECDRAYEEISERLLLSKWEAYPDKMIDIDLPNWYKKGEN